MPTEQEARSMWCPLARVIRRRDKEGEAEIIGPYNRDIISDEDALTREWLTDSETTCVGSDCMAWRWSGPPVSAQFAGRRVGYCGAFKEPS